ncbi:MAG TPA: preprotein translocase subunit YajC [Phycisphaerae bacterium]|nr:preprotein translocase subunit YajC [Phycisphaerae bacterium]
MAGMMAANHVLGGVLGQATAPLVGPSGGGAAPMVGPSGGGATVAPAVNAPAVTEGTGSTATGTAGTAGTTTGTGAPGTNGTQPAEKPGLFQGIEGFLPVILMIGLVYVLLFRGQRKEEKKRKLMVSEMKKGDRVMTIGGLVAKVVSVDGEEVVLKIDEAANVKATYKKSAIQQVLGGEEKAAK